MTKLTPIPSPKFLLCALLIASPLYGTPVAQPGFGSFQKQFATADMVVAGQISKEDRSCSIQEPWDASKRGALCTESIVVDRVYKGQISPGNVVSVQYGRYLPGELGFRHLAQGEYALFVLCKSSTEFVYCPGSIGRSQMVRSKSPSNSENRPGLDLLASELVEGLTETDDINQNINLLWAIGNTGCCVSEMKKVERTLPLEPRTDLDAVLIRSETSTCGADLSEVSKLSAFPGNIFIMLGALEGSGTRCLDQVRFLAASPVLALRFASLHILGAAKDPSTEPILALLVDDKEASVAFNAIRILETITGIRLIKQTSFADFDSNPEIRRNLTEAWKSQLRSRGVAPATLAQ
jgi:hypothetical protein